MATIVWLAASKGVKNMSMTANGAAVPKHDVFAKSSQMHSKMSEVNKDKKVNENVSSEYVQNDIKNENSFRQTKDQYIPEKKEESAGIYSISSDSNGARKINFDEPAKPDSGGSAPEKPKGKDDEKEEKCQTNTDKVDAEIKKLKEKKERLQQQISKSKDDAERERLRKQLSQVENELQLKDNDSYRRQNSVVTEVS